MTNEQMREFEAWLDEPHPQNPVRTRRDCFGEIGRNIAEHAWQAATAKANQWRPVDETVPKTAEEFLTLNRAGHRTIRTGNYLHHMMRCAVVDKEDCFYIGWLPLPPTVTEQDKS